MSPGVAFALAGIPTAMIGRLHVAARAENLLRSIDGGAPRPSRRLHPGQPAVAEVEFRGLQGDIEANTRRQLRLGCILSAYIGAFSGVLGIGGGIVRVPVMVKILRFTPHVATATSLFALTIVSFAGTLVHASEGTASRAKATRRCFWR